jgi:membrane protein YdbS with pleckstrin-like domain
VEIPGMKKDGYELWTERLSIAICLWLCTVPFIFFLGMFFFDVRVAWTAAAVSFVIILLVCNALCTFRLHEFEKEKTA